MLVLVLGILESVVEKFPIGLEIELGGVFSNRWSLLTIWSRLTIMSCCGDLHGVVEVCVDGDWFWLVLGRVNRTQFDQLRAKAVGEQDRNVQVVLSGLLMLDVAPDG